MKFLKRRVLFLLLALVVCIPLVTGCTPEQPPVQDPPPYGGEPTGAAILNGVDVSAYTIVYSDDEPDYNKRAAEYIRSAIKARTGCELAVRDDEEGCYPYEIVVGETNRSISKQLDADTQHTQFALLANETQIAMEGDFFVIAAAAYFFVRTYIPAERFTSVVPQTVSIHEPIVDRADNFIFLIGDGMGLYQTLLFDVMDAPKTGPTAFGDGEDVFYGYYLPYMGMARTNSGSGLTDSAAAGTALATGTKTLNGRIGIDGVVGYDLQSLTELAASLGKRTAVISTEVSTGATPASFSAHASDRSHTTAILQSQEHLVQKYGTIIRCDYNFYSQEQMPVLENEITKTLQSLSEGKNGFFLMYEEAYIDKHCHNNDMQNTLLALMRFNQAIGLFMEYAFYHPNTFVVITADHETGGMIPSTSKGGGFSYSHGNHSTQYVPVFAYGAGADVFDGVVMENVQIPRTIAKYWGIPKFGYGNPDHPALN